MEISTEIYFTVKSLKVNFFGLRFFACVSTTAAVKGFILKFVKVFVKVAFAKKRYTTLNWSLSRVNSTGDMFQIGWHLSHMYVLKPRSVFSEVSSFTKAIFVLCSIAF